MIILIRFSNIIEWESHPLYNRIIGYRMQQSSNEVSSNKVNSRYDYIQTTYKVKDSFKHPKNESSELLLKKIFGIQQSPVLKDQRKLQSSKLKLVSQSQNSLHQMKKQKELKCILNYDHCNEGQTQNNLCRMKGVGTKRILEFDNSQSQTLNRNHRVNHQCIEFLVQIQKKGKKLDVPQKNNLEGSFQYNL